MESAEKKLYGSIGAMFKELGYDKVLIDNFSIQPYKGSRGRRLDVIACRWSEDDLETAAVECKKALPPDGIIEALPQAINTMLFVDETYVATPIGEDYRGVSLLDKLGIGYIAIKDERAFIVHKPDSERMSLKDEEKYIEQVRSRLKTLMIFEEFSAGKKVRVGGMRARDLWVAVDIVPSLEIQQNVWMNSEEGHFYSGINFEKRNPVLRVVKGLTPHILSKFAKAIHSLPSNYRITLKEIYGRRKPEELLPPQWSNGYTISQAQKLVSSMKSIEKRAGSRVELSIHRPVWAIAEDVTRMEGRKRLEKVQSEILPIIRILELAAH
ncbi:MAG: hypothetical protein ACE5KV_02180 [Thermoplasmata archaeon]